MSESLKYCKSCDTLKPISKFNTVKSGKLTGLPQGYCKTCSALKSAEWRKDNPVQWKAHQKTWRNNNKEKIAFARKQYYENQPPEPEHITENPFCPLYLGYHISETVLAHEFKNVVRMPANYPGFDFECNRHFKIDAKSSCQLHNRSNGTYWQFIIKCNQVPHYYILIAWDNRKDLNPVHIWLIPAKLINMKKILYIGNTEKSLKKWSKYERPLTNVIDCCRTLRAKKLLDEDVEEVIKF
jgi:hypothetical protein